MPTNLKRFLTIYFDSSFLNSKNLKVHSITKRRFLSKLEGTHLMFTFLIYDKTYSNLSRGGAKSNQNNDKQKNK